MFIPKHVLHQILAIFPVIIQAFLTGAGCGWVSPILNSFKNSSGEFSLTDEDCSWIASFHYIGRILGSLFVAVLIDRIGRKILLVGSALLMLLVWVGISLTKNVFLHFLIRFAFGSSVGILDTALPVYIGENSSPNLRCVFCTISTLSFFAGELLAFTLATYTSYLTVALVIAVIAVLGMASVTLLREPAQYFIVKGREETAKNIFQWLRGSSETVTKEFDDMKTKLAVVEIRFSLNFLCDGRVRIVVAINMLIFLTGFPALNSFVTFAIVPTTNLSGNELTILYGGAQLIGALFSSTIIEKFGRRTLWILSAIISIVAHSTSATLHYWLAKDNQMVHSPLFVWILFASVTAYATVFAALILPLTGTVRAELLPTELKAAGICTSIILNSATGFFISRIFLIIANTFGMETNFVFFAFSSLIMLVYVYIYLPETRNKTLMEIQKLFDGY